MYRDNEGSRVSAVLDRKLAGDRDGMVDAVVQLWLQPQEQAGDDTAQAEVWGAIVDASAVDAAVAAGLRLIRDRQRIRPSAFIDLGEAIEDPKVLLEIAELVLETDWDVHPYLAAAFMRLVERKQEDALWKLIGRHRTRLSSSAPHWLLVAVILTTTRIGDRHDLDRWFQIWTELDGIPMWILATYCATVERLGGRLGKLIEIARAAIETAKPDVTIAYFATLLAIDELQHDRDPAFVKLLDGYGAEIAAYASSSAHAHPLVGYLDAVKRRHRITGADLCYLPADAPAAGLVGLTVLAVQGTPERPMNWRVGPLISEMLARAVPPARLLPLFATMIALERGDARVRELYRLMFRSRPSEMPQIQPAWKRLARARTTWFQYVKLNVL